MKLELTHIDKVSLKGFPARKRPMDAGADLSAAHDFALWPGQTEKFKLAFGLKIPNGYVGIIAPRSSLSEAGVVCHTSIIDASYSGKIHVVLTNCGKETYRVKEGERIAQLVISPCAIADFVTEPLEERGENGFGSTGK